MQIWVDADACPLVIKKILFKAANRTHILVTFVSNQFLLTPPSPYIATLRVTAGFDVADKEILKKMCANDLVVTADIPLAYEVVEQGGIALNPRGELYSHNNISQRLSMRNFSEELRSSGVKTKNIPKLSQREVQAFANHLDKILSQMSKT